MGRNNITSVSLAMFCIVLLIKCVNCQTKISCNNTANFTSNTSTFAINRDILLNSLPSNVSSNKTPGSFFYTTSVGEGSDKVYGHAICQADTPPQACSDSLRDAVQELISACPNQKEAISVSRYTIRYADRPINGELVLEPSKAGYNIDDLDSNNTVAFYQVWYQLMEEAIERTSVEPIAESM